MRAVSCRAARRGGHAVAHEKEHLLPLAAEDFDLAEVSFRVSIRRMCAAGTNFYSVPLKAGSVVEARVYSSVVEFRQAGVWWRSTSAVISGRSRSSISNTISKYSNGSLARCADRSRWRSAAQGRWPESYDRSGS